MTFQPRCTSEKTNCAICEKNCPHNAVHIIDNLSVKDYSKCQNCGICAEKCPRKLIFFPGSPAQTEHSEQKTG